MTDTTAAAVAAVAGPSGPAALPLAGRVAIVTGASRGIGRAIAAHLSALGASVVLGYTSSAAEADALAAELPRAVAVRADVSEEAGVRSLFDAAESAFGAAPHILVANAGVLDDKYPSVADTATADFDRVLAVNTRGAFLCLREAANRLPRGGGGRIVAVTSSVVGSLPTGYAAYTASKAAVEAMVRTMAKELKGTRITANCVAPGATATDMFFAGKSEETVRRFAATNPMERIGEAGDIAPVVGFLCTDAAEWVNGQVIRANGGLCSNNLRVNVLIERVIAASKVITKEVRLLVVMLARTPMMRTSHMLIQPLHLHPQYKEVLHELVHANLIIRNDGPSMDERDKHWSMITHGDDGSKRVRIEDDATAGDFGTLKPP